MTGPRGAPAAAQVAGSIQKNAVKVETQCTGFTTTTRRLLNEALTALAGCDEGQAAA